MNLIAGASRLWSSLTGWDLLLAGGVLAWILLITWWVRTSLSRHEQAEAQAQIRQRLDSIMEAGDPNVRPWPPRKAGQHAQPWRERSKGGAA